jgi:hypothetical protein
VFNACLVEGPATKLGTEYFQSENCDYLLRIIDYHACVFEEYKSQELVQDRLLAIADQGANYKIENKSYRRPNSGWKSMPRNRSYMTITIPGLAPL